MNEVFIPKGKTMKVEHMEASVLHVRGVLIATGSITAQRIIGKGALRCDRLSAKTIVADCIDARTICCDKLAVRCASAKDIVARRGILATNKIDATSIHTPKLTTYEAGAERLEVRKFVLLKEKSRGLLLTVLTSNIEAFFSSVSQWWTSLGKTTPATEIMDADYEEKDSTEQSSIRLVPLERQDAA